MGRQYLSHSIVVLRSKRIFLIEWTQMLQGTLDMTLIIKNEVKETAVI